MLGWDEPRRLLEVGVSISRSGRRHTGLERGEQDQGQYDGQRDTLAVGSAGLLVRRSLWSDLGGFDRSLPFFREDVDLGWRANLAGHRVAVATDAVVHHAEAMARGRRAGVVGDPHATDRASALYTLLANGRGSTLLLRWLWLLVQTLVRALGNVLGKAPREAAAEMSAVGMVLMRPRRLRSARRTRRRWRLVRARTLRGLFPPPGQQVRHSLETLAGSLSVETDVAPSTILESGPVEDDLDSFVGAGSGRLASVDQASWGIAVHRTPRRPADRVAWPLPRRRAARWRAAPDAHRGFGCMAGVHGGMAPGHSGKRHHGAPVNSGAGGCWRR